MEGGRITRVKSCSICGIRTRNLSYSQLFVKEMKTKYLRLSARPQRNSCSCSPASVTFEIYLLKGCCGTGTNALCRPSFFSSFLGAIQMILKFVNTMQTVHEILLLIPDHSHSNVWRFATFTSEFALLLYIETLPNRFYYCTKLNIWLLYIIHKINIIIYETYVFQKSKKRCRSVLVN